MGAFDNTNETITIPTSPEQAKEWGWEPHESVTVRTVVTVEDEEAVNNQVMKMVSNFGKGKKNQALDIQSNLGATRRLWIQRMLVSWTFTKNGMPIPISAESLKQLKGSYLDRIYDAIQAEQEQYEQDEDEAENFTSDASSITEEASSEPIPIEMSRNYLLKS